ncbi:MAG: trigger factor [Clostridiaceae bacterium]|nr:trigger factor [Clostridiaceae bacterium]MDY5016197.1 trigger factor [Eubacteriales bacterium]
MEIKRNEKTAVNTVELEIAVTGADFESAIQQAYRKDVAKINVPGFRRGKAPRKIIEQLYGKAVFYEEAVNSATPAAYEAAVKEAALEPVAQPELEIVSIDENGFVFKAVVTTKPVATVGDYQSIRAERKVDEVTDADVDAAIERLAQRNARIETVERPAENGDIAVIDYEGLLDGTAFEGGSAEDYELKLGSGTFIPGFEDQVVGHSAGEQFDVNVSFPEDYHAEDLKGKAVVFKVRLHEVKKSTLPTLDDEFAKDVSEFDTLAALRDDERAKLVKTREHNADQAFESAIMEKLSAITDVEIPDAMIESRIDNIAEDFAYRFQMQGISMDQYFKMTGSNMEDFRASFRDRATMQVKISLALEAVAKAENITVTPEDIEAEYVKLAGENGKVEQIKSYISADALAHDMIAERAMNLLKEIAAKEPIETAEAEKPAEAAEGENA